MSPVSASGQGTVSKEYGDRVMALITGKQNLRIAGTRSKN